MTDAGTVMTRDGAVAGIERDDVEGGPVRAYLGIPYATAARFASPVAAAPWDGVLAANTFGPVSPQVPGAQFQPHEIAQSEDCLSVNVWTPASAGADRPVLVWIHGGAFRQGSGASPLYDGAQLAARGDAVVVTCNYRLGALGFLGHPSLGGTGGPHANWGLLDQVEVLRWVRDNAAAFGGDPGNVTIFGESAGAVSVTLLCTMPSARGLFHKAVVQSGGPMAMSDSGAARRAEQLADLAGVDTVEALRDLPLDQLLAAQARIDGVELRGFVPVVDGDVLPEPPLDALVAGAAAGLPTIIGTNVDEWKLWAPMDPHSRDLDADGLRHRLAKRFPEESVDGLVAAVALERESLGEPVGSNDLFFAIETERFFRVPSLRAADAQAGHAPTFVYLFGWESPAMRGWLGACHGLEIAFVFGNQGRGELAAFTGHGPDADELGARMMDAWIAFARTGDPSTAALPWPRHDPATRPTLVFDASSRVELAPREAARAAVAATSAL